MSGWGTEQVCDLILKYLRDNIADLHGLIEGVMGDIEQAIVTADSDALSKVTAARTLGEIAEDLRALERAALCEGHRDAIVSAVLDAAGALLRALFDLKAGRPLNDVEKGLRGLQLTLSVRVLERLPVDCGKRGGASGQA